MIRWLCLPILLLALPAGAAPSKIPVQGVLTDPGGAPIHDELEVVFTLYADAAGNRVVWSEARPVPFSGGFFTVLLGDVMPIEPEVFRDHPALWLGVAVDGDDEMPLIELGAAPYAAFAALAGDAATVGGRAPEAFAEAGHAHDFASLRGVPADLADGDDDTTYEARPGGGLELSAGAFGLLSICAEGQVLASRSGSWVCADDAVGPEGRISEVALAGDELRITEDGRTSSVSLASLRDDADADPLNEVLRSAVLSGATLELTDAGGTSRVDLSSLIDADGDPRNELLQDARLIGTELRLIDAGGTRIVDLSALAADDDADSGNELIQALALEGTRLRITEGGTDVLVDLAALVNDADADPRNELQNLAMGADGVLSISGGNQVPVLRDAFALSVQLGADEGSLAVLADSFNGDDVAQVVPLPFSVTYGGTSYQSVLISTNGWLEFGGAAGASAFNRCLPEAGRPGPFVAAYWDDLISTVRWATEGAEPNRVFKVYFDGRLWSGGANIDFSVQIHEGSGAISVRYFDCEPGACGEGATIGFQTAGAAAGTGRAYPISCNARVLDHTTNDATASEQGWSVTPLR